MVYDTLNPGLGVQPIGNFNQVIKTTGSLAPNANQQLADKALIWLDEMDFTGEGTGGTYYLDLSSGVLQRVGREMSGSPLPGNAFGKWANPYWFGISEDGRWVAYQSADWLIANPNSGGAYQIFDQDMHSVRTTNCPIAAFDALAAVPFEDASQQKLLADPNAIVALMTASGYQDQVMRGLTADGVSRLLLRAVVPQAGQVQFTSGDAATPLSSLDGSQVQPSITATAVPYGSQYVAFAVLRPTSPRWRSPSWAQSRRRMRAASRRRRPTSSPIRWAVCSPASGSAAAAAPSPTAAPPTSCRAACISWCW